MSNFDPEKLLVEYRNDVTISQPLFQRHYTLTHSDTTGELFLTIGTNFAWDKINPLRDEVLGKWETNGNSLFFSIYIYIDQGEYTEMESARRSEIFRRELPLALKAIRYGDQVLFNAYPRLDQCSIIVHFISVFPSFSRKENWGTVSQFTI